MKIFYFDLFDLNEIRSFFHKVFNTFIAFTLIFTLAFVTIETIDPEPASATTDFACFTSGGKAYAYQSVWNSGLDRLEIYRWEAAAGQSYNSNGNTTLVAYYEADNNNNFGSAYTRSDKFMALTTWLC